MVIEFNSVYAELAQFLVSLSIGEATAKLLELNQSNKVEERFEMRVTGFDVYYINYYLYPRNGTIFFFFEFSFLQNRSHLRFPSFSIINHYANYQRTILTFSFY